MEKPGQSLEGNKPRPDSKFQGFYFEMLQEIGREFRDARGLKNEAIDDYINTLGIKE